ncbi:AraC-type DNA-binding protein [Amycolatopsis lurida]|uniref:AraC family transcriptional regulator n=1 Tax=Amycolatopsis lurida NRRL 2430 TaxID=1460371 RepID=A0A2P2FR01_AMYLU|nr:AraC family transcriptional regulator [Amycolatopsis lurida NRRL 2430]SEC98565.1 AraC-type DNA-binding protein [Amycolatopsis lurida]
MQLRTVAMAANEKGVTEPGRHPEPASPLQPAVLQAISAMHARYFDPITLSDLAQEVFVSPFHFSRIFAKATGVTPGRYLTAIRLFEAKRLLLTTSLTVSDIVCSVGYSSVGTFTSRFTRAVGMTPTQYRDPEVGELLVAMAPHFQRLPTLEALHSAGMGSPTMRTGTGTISVRVETPRGAGPATVLIGLFAESIPQCGPVAFGGRANVLSADIEIQNVPEGRWTVIGVAEHAAGTAASSFSMGTLPGRVDITRYGMVHLRMPMRAPLPTDAPMAITLAGGPTSAGNRMVAPAPGYLRAVA